MRRNGKFLPLLGATGLLLGAALTGCSDSGGGSGPGSDSESASPKKSASESASASPSGSASASGSAPASVRNGLKALDTGEKDVQGGTAFDLERDDDGSHQWDLKVATEDGKQFDLRISEDGGKVTQKREDTTPDDDVSKLKGAEVTAQKAVHIASGRHKGEDLASLEIDQDAQGTLIWQVNTVKGDGGGDGASADADDAAENETLIDARTGKVTGQKADD
ncbi:PepSY domain-containing protein [Streptomyces daliensis]|uniref:PepSY domain-containing protein n=1 Tax=Streptomyces daliensis TaxID=299421 RepID=A0A8T4IIA9_9ACTN|nr:PepSY domain-containing protein [Streptomyces daliensis]